MPSQEKEKWGALKEKWSKVPNESAIPPLKSFVDMYPDHEEAKILLARHLVFFNPENALSFIEDIKMESPQFSTAQQIRKVHEYADHPAYRTFQQNYLDEGLLSAFTAVNERILSSDEKEKEVLEKLGVALHALVESKELDLQKARRVFDMYTNA